MDLSRLIEYDPWWDTGRVRKELCPDHQRHLLARILSSLRSRQVVRS